MGILESLYSCKYAKGRSRMNSGLVKQKTRVIKMPIGCVCKVCEYGPDESDVPITNSWQFDVFCSIGSQETSPDGVVRTIPAYVKPFFSNDLAPPACQKMLAHVKLMTSRSSQHKVA